jgi:phospholipase/lecithinase/hemolysin
MSTAVTDFTSLVFFGDSLTDNGNLYARFGTPAAPYFQGRFSNGPTYAERVPDLIGVASGASDNYAFGGARAIDRDAGTEITPATPQIDLADQVRSYIAGLAGGVAAPGTAAALYIGNNDFLSPQADLTDPATAQAYIQAIGVSIGTAALQLAGAGVSKIIVFTLPHVTFSPLGASLPPAQLAGANALIDATNALAIAGVVEQLTAAGVAVEVVDTGKFTDEIGMDPTAFGFRAPLSTPMTVEVPNEATADPTDTIRVATGVEQLFPLDQIAFFDEVHPTAAAHGVTAAFVAASLAADSVVWAVAGDTAHDGTAGSDLVFAGDGDDAVEAEGGDDTVLAGTGDDHVHLGRGNDIGAGGSGDDELEGQAGNDLLAGNDGDDWLDGGRGDDVLVLGRGADGAEGGRGADLFIVEAEAAHGSCTGDWIDGGAGRDVLLIEVSAAQEAALRADIDALHGRSHGELSSIGLSFRRIERIEVVVTGLDTASSAVADAAVVLAPDLTDAIRAADLWGFI